MTGSSSYVLRVGRRPIVVGPLSLVASQAIAATTGTTIGSDRADVRVTHGDSTAAVEANPDGTVGVRWEQPNELFPRFLAAPAWIDRLQRLINDLGLL